MSFSVKKLFFTFTFNVCLFFMLIIGIQNSSNKNKVKFIFNESAELPLSFIIGTSFISGSLLSSLVNINFLSKKFKKDPTMK